MQRDGLVLTEMQIRDVENCVRGGSFDLNYKEYSVVFSRLEQSCQRNGDGYYRWSLQEVHGYQDKHRLVDQ